jgi:hypothetical protein
VILAGQARFARRSRGAHTPTLAVFAQVPESSCEPNSGQTLASQTQPERTSRVGAAVIIVGLKSRVDTASNVVCRSPQLSRAFVQELDGLDGGVYLPG